MKNVLLIVGAASSLYILQAVRRPFQTTPILFYSTTNLQTLIRTERSEGGAFMVLIDSSPHCVFFYGVIVI